MYFSVPTANDPTTAYCGTTFSTACHIVVWSGLTNNVAGSDVLAQSGTDSVCTGFNCATSRTYSAWVQIWDSGIKQVDTNCPDTPVSANTPIYTNTLYYTASPAHYLGYIQEQTTGKFCASPYNTTKQPHYAQFIGEKPSVAGVQTKLAKFTDFNVEGYFYDNGVSQGLYNMYGTGYDYQKHVIGTSVSDPWVNAGTVNSVNKFLLDWIKSF